MEELISAGELILQKHDFTLRAKVHSIDVNQTILTDFLQSQKTSDEVMQDSLESRLGAYLPGQTFTKVCLELIAVCSSAQQRLGHYFEVYFPHKQYPFKPMIVVANS